MEKLRVSFGRPEHGWLPVRLSVGDFELSFNASAVPNDALADLVAALNLVSQGAAAEVRWHLEPERYRLLFHPQPGGITHLEMLAEGRAPLLSWQASHAEVVLPFWRALRRLNPADFAPPHWPAWSGEKLATLTSRIRPRRGAG